MKGNPALRTVLVLLLLAAVSYPVMRVISHSEHPALSPEASVEPSQLTGILHIKTAPAPLRLEVTSGAKVILGLSDQIGGGEFSKEASLPSGSDLIVRAEWEDDRPHALHAEFLPSGTNAPVCRDYWANHTLEDVLSLP